MDFNNFAFLTQRVLEHCDDPKTQQIVMDEILQSVCMLAQDQYGNYVVQVSKYILITPLSPFCMLLFLIGRYRIHSLFHV